MQRVSDGLAVPKQQMDVFTGKTTGGGVNAGEITCELTYVPKSVYHIIIPPIMEDGGNIVQAIPWSLTGKSLLIKVYDYRYDKPDTPTAGSNSGNAGADPHTHDIAFHEAIAHALLLNNTILSTVRVDYTVA